METTAKGLWLSYPSMNCAIKNHNFIQLTLCTAYGSLLWKHEKEKTESYSSYRTRLSRFVLSWDYFSCFHWHRSANTATFLTSFKSCYFFDSNLSFSHLDAYKLFNSYFSCKLIWKTNFFFIYINILIQLYTTTFENLKSSELFNIVFKNYLKPFDIFKTFSIFP